MALDDEATAAAEGVHDYIVSNLQVKFPFLNAAALEKLARGLATFTHDFLHEQEDAMIKSKAAFSFFSLYPEIRNRIYELMLFSDGEDDDEPYEVDIWQPRSPSLPYGKFKWPVLIYLNRQIRNEALPIFLGQNTFVASFAYDNPDVAFARLKKWLEAVGPKSAKLIRELVIRCRNRSETQAIIRQKYTETPTTRKNVLRALDLEKQFGVEDAGIKVHYGILTADNRSTSATREWLELLDDGSTKEVMDDA